MKLYDYYRSSASYRLRIALNIKKLKPEREFVNLLQGEQRGEKYRQINPQGSVPTLVDGDVMVSQSLAAIEYLDEIYPEPPLLPEDVGGRARVRSLAFAIACDIHPLNNLRVLRYLSEDLQVDDEVKQRWYEHWVAEGFAFIEKMLESPLTGKYCHGDKPSMADICLVPQVFNAKRYACDLTPFPQIRRIFDACEETVFFADAHPENQPDAIKH